MTEKEYVPFGVEIYVSNLELSKKFYSETLGFKILREDSSHNFISFEFNNAIFMIEERPELAQPTKGIVMRFVVPDIKTYYADLQKMNVEIVKPLAVTDYGPIRFYVKDPDGYQLKFAGK